MIEYDINNNDTNLDREEIEDEELIEDDAADAYMQRLAEAVEQRKQR